MTPLERLTQRFTFRSVMIVVAATIFLALSLTSEHVTAVATLAATVVGVAAPLAAGEDNDTAIRPFRVNVPTADLADLRRRLEATRWPTKELVADRAQGVQLATLREL